MNTNDIPTVDTIKHIATTALKKRTVAGLDRVSRASFISRLDQECQLIHDKISSGDYRVTRYRSLLRAKGPTSLPREIAVPTIRDRIALRAILQPIRAAFPTAMETEVPNQKVRAIRDWLLTQGSSDRIEVAKIDIKCFFDSIEHEQLLAILGPKLSRPLLAMIRSAIETSCVKGKNRSCGLPQGIAISPALADIYLSNLPAMKTQGTRKRYVDDILIVGPSAHDEGRNVRDTLSKLGLDVNIEKSFDVLIDFPKIEFIGYQFSRKGATVSKAATERFLSSIARICGRFRDRSNRYAPFSMSTARRTEILVGELNDRITGFIRRDRIIGWISYFSAMNDAALLKRLDGQVKDICSRVPELRTAGVPIKTLMRTFHAVRHDRRGGYIKNYDAMSTPPDRRRELEAAGYMSQAQSTQIEESQVAPVFERFLDERERDFERDIGLIS